MRVHVVDPAAFTPPYDHALSAALAGAGADVTLVTGPFAHGETPRMPGYAVDERFYRWSPAGRAQHSSALPSGGGATGSGSWRTSPASTVVRQPWQAPMRHEASLGTALASASSSRLANPSSHVVRTSERAKATTGPGPAPAAASAPADPSRRGSSSDRCC